MRSSITELRNEFNSLLEKGTIVDSIPNQWSILVFNNIGKGIYHDRLFSNEDNRVSVYKCKETNYYYIKLPFIAATTEYYLKLNLKDKYFKFKTIDDIFYINRLLEKLDNYIYFDSANKSNGYVRPYFCDRYSVYGNEIIIDIKTTKTKGKNNIISKIINFFQQ